MNATPAVSQTPIAADPAQISSAASPNSVNSGGKGGDFAAALSKAGAKPNRKPTSGAAGSGRAGAVPDGGLLPGAGNPSPPPTVSVGTSVAAPDGAGIDSIGGGAAMTAAEAKAADPSATGASTAAPGSAQGAQVAPVAQVAPGPAGPAPGMKFSLDLPAGAGEQGAQGTDKAALPAAGSAGASLQELAAAKAAAVGRAATSGGTSVGIRSTTAANSAAISAPGAAAPSGATSSASAQANAAASDPTSLGATAAVMVAATGAVADNSTTADSTLSPAADLAAPAGSTVSAAGANGAPTPGIPVVAGRLAAVAASVTAASTAALVTASAGTAAADKHARSDTGDSSAGAVAPGPAMPGASAPGAADAASAPTLKVAAGVDSPEFGQGLADRLSWMVDNNVSSAKLQVNPPQLGPIEVRIALQGDHAQVWLVSHSAVTRDALQSSSPHLREMLGAQGFGQVSVDISQRDFQDRSAHAQPYDRAPAAMTASAPAITAVAASLPRLSSGAVDAYA